MSKKPEYIKLINTRRWQRLRKAQLTAHPLCQRCEQNGLIKAATEVHHIVPIEWAKSEQERTQRAYDPHNLMSLCRECHAKEHKEMGSHSHQRVQVSKEKKLKRFIDKFKL